MRWEDERYVRLYTRDSATWALLPWQGRCLLPLLLRKVDRAGVLEVLEGEEVAAIAELVKVPPEVVEPGLDALVKRGTVVVGGGKLRMPSFLAAQEARSSDKLRQQKSRELAAITQDVSHAVTRGHTPSQHVTPSLAVPSLAKEKHVAEDSATGPAGEIFEHWKTATKKPRAKLDPKRKRLIDLRLAEGHALEDIKAAIDGFARSPFHNGENDRHKKYLGLQTMLRDAAQIEHGLDLLMEHDATTPKATKFIEPGKDLYADPAP